MKASNWFSSTTGKLREITHAVVAGSGISVRPDCKGAKEALEITLYDNTSEKKRQLEIHLTETEADRLIEKIKEWKKRKRHDSFSSHTLFVESDAQFAEEPEVPDDPHGAGGNVDG